MGDVTVFALNSEQIDNLKSWKNSLQSQQALDWAANEEAAEERIHDILTEANFEKGENLTAGNFDEIFSEMRNFSNNRNLSKLLYEKPGLEIFNQRLRNLYYGKDPFVDRVNDFFKLPSIGDQTLSQFLIALDSRKYPLITKQTEGMIALDTSQEEAAGKVALERYGIQDSSKYPDRTKDFLASTVLFEAIKSATGVEKYTQVNNLIWFGYMAQGEDPDAPMSSTSITSVRLEMDLRDNLAINPSIIEKGLTLIKKEFDTKEVGKIDLLCTDKNGCEVVVELKKLLTSDAVVGQTLRYIGWVMKNRTKKVRGIIIIHEPDQRLECALIPMKDTVEIKYYKVRFEIANEYTP